MAQAPVIADVVVSEIYDGANRFTDKEFPYVTTMVIDGEPDPTFEVKAKLSGTTFDFDVRSDVITDVEGGGIKTCETDLIESVNINLRLTTQLVLTAVSIDSRKRYLDGDINTRTVPVSPTGAIINMAFILTSSFGNYSGPLFSWNNQSGGNDKYFAYVNLMM